MGVALRFIWSDLTGGYSADGEYVEPGWSIAADISGYYGQKVDFDWGKGYGAFGFNISNIGKKVEYGDYRSAAFLPTNLRLGGSFTMPIDMYNHISLNVDLNKLLVPSRPIYNSDVETEEEYLSRQERYDGQLVTKVGFTKEQVAAMSLAEKMAENWLNTAVNEDGSTRLTFDSTDGFSMKYNMVWDKVWGTALFSQEFMDRELKNNKK